MEKIRIKIRGKNADTKKIQEASTSSEMYDFFYGVDDGQINIESLELSIYGDNKWSKWEKFAIGVEDDD